MYIPVLDVDHTLGMSVPKVGVVRRTVVHHGFIDGIGSLVRENASGQAGNDLFDLQRRSSEISNLFQQLDL